MNIIRYFPYLGPSRRSDHRVVEIQLDAGAENGSNAPGKTNQILKLLTDSLVLKAGEKFPRTKPPEEYDAWFAAMLAELALLFQQKGGHRVCNFELTSNHLGDECILLVEHEHCDVGMNAVKLAAEIMTGSRKKLLEPYRQFIDFARQRALPLETEALIKAATRKGIPFSQLEHPPLGQGVGRNDCIRPNGLVRYGHGAASRVMDGTFYVDRTSDYLRALRKNPGLRERLLQEIGAPAGIESPGKGRAERSYQVLVIGGRLITTEIKKGFPRVHDEIHPDTRELMHSISERCSGIPVAISLKASNLNLSLSQNGGAITGFTLAPDLAECSGNGFERDLLETLAEAVIDDLFPDLDNARMPIFAVTGTNGKTTTCRLIAQILKQAGYHPGLVSTDGVYLDGKRISDQDASSFMGHARVLSSNLVNAAVLENHHTGIAVRGFAYDRCDVGLCLNVSHDHIVDGEIGSVEHMASIKRAIPARATKAAVLFADDPHTRNMINGLGAKEIGLVSLESGAQELQELLDGRPGRLCVLESSGEQEKMVLYDRSRRIELPAVTDIPITVSGTARFMVSNAMHAALAAWQFGVAPEVISEALVNFLPGPETTPGRLNIYDDLDFRIVVDFGHNPDGMRAICDFAERQQVTGRKILAFSGSAKRDDLTKRLIAKTVAGHFDLYFCKEYTSEAVGEYVTVELMKTNLMECGVEEQSIRITTTGEEAFHEVFDACEPGDLLILLIGTFDLLHFNDHIQAYFKRVKGS